MSQLVALRVTLYLVYVEPRVVWIMGNLPLQVVDPFSERLATLAWKKLDHKQNQNTIDIILFIIITTCFYFNQEKDSHKTQSSILIFLYMLYMFIYPLFWYFDISDILIKKEKHTIYHVLQISSLSWFVFTHSDVASITLMILLIHVCIVWFVGGGIILLHASL